MTTKKSQSTKPNYGVRNKGAALDGLEGIASRRAEANAPVELCSPPSEKLLTVLARLLVEAYLERFVTQERPNDVHQPMLDIGH